MLSSCRFKTQEQKEWEKYAENEISSRIGEKLYLPDSCLIAGENGIMPFYLSGIRAKKRIVTYIDISCSACLNNFSFWDKFIKEAGIKNITCEYLIYINGGESCLEAIRQLTFYHPVLLDSSSVFIEKNSLWDKRFQTALLNERNEVVLIGDPTVNEKLKDLYMDVLLNKGE
jgi:hypothetical protein